MDTWSSTSATTRQSAELKNPKSFSNSCWRWFISRCTLFSCKSQSAKPGWAQVHAWGTFQTLAHVLRRVRHVDDLALGECHLDCRRSTPITLTIRWLCVDYKNLFQAGERERRLKSPFVVQFKLNDDWHRHDDTSQDQHSHQEMISDWSDTHPPWRVHSIGDACKLQRGEQSPANISHDLLTDIKRRFLDAHSSWTGALPECYQPQLSVWMVVNQSSSIHEWSRVMCHNRREVNFWDAYGLHERWTSATSNLPFC